MMHMSMPMPSYNDAYAIIDAKPSIDAHMQQIAEERES